MSRTARMSWATRRNWLIDSTLFFGALGAAISGIYFLVVPTGGYQGGRNPWYGITIVFARESWDDLHIWTGVAMIVAAAIHAALHWDWIMMMARRMISVSRSSRGRFSRGAKINVAVDLAVALSFFLTAGSGLYFLFGTAGGYQGGNNPAWDPGFLFSRTTWDLIHTWAAVTMIVSAVLHFAIHWRWITNVTRNFFVTILRQPKISWRSV